MPNLTSWSENRLNGSPALVFGALANTALDHEDRQEELAQWCAQLFKMITNGLRIDAGKIYELEQVIIASLHLNNLKNLIHKLIKINYTYLGTQNIVILVLCHRDRVKDGKRNRCYCTLDSDSNL